MDWISKLGCRDSSMKLSELGINDSSRWYLLGLKESVNTGS